MTDTPKPDALDFWPRVDKTPGHGPNGDCWTWLGAKNHGYGVINRQRATRISLELDGRPRTGSQIALHSCDNPSCVNPGHLRWGDHSANMADMSERKRHWKAKVTHCPKGHKYETENTRVVARPNGEVNRRCVICHRISNRAHYQRQKERANG